MRLPSIELLLCVATAAAASSARVFVYDSASQAHSASSSETVDAVTARLIVAQRLDLGQYHTLSSTDDESIRQINAFSAEQQPLFGFERHAETTSRVLVVADGFPVDKLEPDEAGRSFSTSPAPHAKDTLELFSTFSQESTNSPYHDGPDSHVTKILQPLAQLETSTFLQSHNRRTLLHVKTDLGNQQLIIQAIKDLHALSQSRKMSITILVTPPSHSTSSPSNTPYGLTKRAPKAQRAQPEKPLISHNKPQTSKPSPPEHFSPVLATKVLTGAIPTCFPSKQSCQRSTNNCTSHGVCTLKWSTSTFPDEDGKQDCYGCACTKPEVRTNKDGTKKTTRFGGGACHKKDIVFPFWLLAGSTVVLVFIVTFGVGLLYEMGNQELPSVIGAGVSGPKGAGR